MIAYFLLGLLLFAGFVLILRWFTQAEPRQALRTLAWTLGIVLAVAGVALLWMGRYHLAWIGLPALLALAGRARQALNAARLARRVAGSAAGGGAGGSAGTQGMGRRERQSTVTTAYLAMILDHDTGAMSGRVRAGRFAGADLADLDLDGLVALWGEVQDDPQSAAVLQSYLDRVHGDAWRERAAEGDARGAGNSGGTGGGGTGGGGGTANGTGPMDADEARAILGVGPEADAAAIRAAYRALMQKLHPDHGGSTYFATKINEARRVLLGE